MSSVGAVVMGTVFSELKSRYIPDQNGMPLMWGQGVRLIWRLTSGVLATSDGPLVKRKGPMATRFAQAATTMDPVVQRPGVGGVLNWHHRG